MPFAIIKLPTGKYSVINTDSGKIYAKHTTKENAKKQLGLLYSLHLNK